MAPIVVKVVSPPREQRTIAYSSATELTWADQVDREGREVGRVQGLREAIERLVRARFGRMAPEPEAKVMAMTREEDLAAFVERVGNDQSEADLLAS